MEQTTETKLGRKKHQKKMYWVYVHTSKYHTHVHTYIRIYVCAQVKFSSFSPIMISVPSAPLPHWPPSFTTAS